MGLKNNRRRRKAMKDLRKRRKENGLCPECGKKMDRIGHYCSVCLKRKNEHTKDNRDLFRENGLCTECGKNRVYGSDITCFECRVKINKSRKPLTAEQKKRNNERGRNLYRQRIEQGICTRCGKHKNIPGKKKCGICLEYDRESQKRMRVKRINIKEYRHEKHLCYHCGEAIDLEKGQLCSDCLERCRLNGLKSGGGNEYWKKDNKLIFKSK